MERFLWKGFVWDKNKLSEAETVSGPYFLIDKDMNNEFVNKMNNEKAAGPSGSSSEIVKSIGQAEQGLFQALF